MRVRHVTAASNVDPGGLLIDPAAVRHGLIVGGRIAELAGPVDLSTHLNFDFPEHGLEQCAIAERLEIGAAILRDLDGFQLAQADPADYQPLGRVDLNARLLAWRVALAGLRGTH